MPLLDLSSEEALGNRKTNPDGGWGDRSGANRVEPVCKPNFQVPFRLEPEHKIFTIGSCFARNVEQVLEDRGFDLPACEIFKRPDFIGTRRGILNNYATPSIYNEIAWAFGEENYPRDDLIAEVSSGKFVDLNLTPSLRPDTQEVVDNRRRAITEAYLSSASCEVIIMTLGLSEVWFDNRTRTYLNVSPRPIMLREDPDRFRLHVLSYSETLGFLIKAIDLLRKHGKSDQRIIFTVSPVPLIRTHRAQDVILANCYSKSVLRAAVEEVVASYPSALYFPSYESFVISSRTIAFVDDMIHTNMDLVSLNVGRMVDAYAGHEDTPSSLRDALARGGELIAVEKAGSIAPQLADAFFEEHGEWSEQSLKFAKVHARHLIEAGRASEAAELLTKHEIGGDLEHVTLSTEALVAIDEPEKALCLIELLPDGPIRAVRLWDNMLSAAIAVGDPSTVLAILARISSDVKIRIPAACLRGARFFRDRGDQQKASELYEMGCNAGPTNIMVLEYAESLLAIGEPKKARDVLNMIEVPSPAQVRRREQLAFLALSASESIDAG